MRPVANIRPGETSRIWASEPMSVKALMMLVLAMRLGTLACRVVAAEGEASASQWSRAMKSARRFTIIDGMVLVSAIAVGLGLVRLGRWSIIVPRGMGARNWFAALVGWPIAAAPCVLMVSAALLALRFVGPRPPRRRIFRRPGAMACLSAVVTPITSGWPLWAVMEALGWHSGDPGWETIVIIQVLQCGAGVVVSWLVLKLAGLRCARRDWIDRAGIAVGCYWIVACLILTTLIVGRLL